MILSHNKTNYGTKRGDFWDRRSRYYILRHNEMKYGTEQDHFLGQEKLTYGHNEMNFGTE